MHTLRHVGPQLHTDYTFTACMLSALQSSGNKDRHGAIVSDPFFSLIFKANMSNETKEKQTYVSFFIKTKCFSEKPGNLWSKVHDFG